MSLPKLLNLGTITRVHGVKGAFVVQTPSEKNSSLPHLKTIQIGLIETQTQEYTLIETSWMPSGWKVQVKEVTSKEDAQKLVNAHLFASRESLPKTEEKEYYEVDLIGLSAYHAETQKLFGTFLYSEPISQTNRFQQDRWWFKTPSGEVSIPATKRYLEKVDLENKKIWLKNLNDFEDSDEP